MRKRVFKTFAAAALATTIAGTTIIGSTAFADEISTLTQQKQDKQNELDQLQQQAAYLLTEMSSLEQDMADLSDEIDQTNAVFRIPATPAESGRRTTGTDPALPRSVPLRSEYSPA